MAIRPPTIELLGVQSDCCHECNKHGPGVRFRLFRDKDNVSFLCWEHFRLNTDILLEAGLLWRHPREPLMFTVIQPAPLVPAGRVVPRRDDANSDTHTETRTTSWGRSVSESRNWSESDGHAEPT